MVERQPSLLKSLVGALFLTVMCGLIAGPSLAEDGSYEDLLQKLKEKGVLTEEEYQSLTKAREEAAQAKSARLKFFGDIRIRYETRAASSTFPIAEVGGATGEQLDRFRYSVRFGIRGDLPQHWFYGLRLETSSNPRSAWATFGNSNSNTGGGAAPYGKVGIFVGQAYLGWKATPWLTLQAGKMPNPIFTTPMVWDTDINPEGFAERVNLALNDRVSLFVNLGQYIYSQFSPNDESSNLGFAGYEGYQFAWQAGVSTTFGEKKSAKVALGFYNYSGFGSPDFPGEPNNNPDASGFSGPFAFGPPNTIPNTSAGLAFANGLNDLSYLEVPWEVNFPIGSIDATVFGDWAYNTKADDRAARGSYAFLGDEGMAYQLGMGVGTNVGLVMNQVPLKKHTWEARAYWQSIELNALDTNIIEADFFEGRTNMQGVFAAAVYCPTDAIYVALRYADAYRVNGDGPTPGSNPDLADVQPIDRYELFQLEFGWKF